MLKVRPPTHKIDAGGIFISMGDCWDQARLELEYKQLDESALAKIQEAALSAYKIDHPEATEVELEEVKASCILSEEERQEAHGAHPWSRFYRGKTRYQPDADEWDHEGKPVKLRSYLTSEPTEFALRRLSFADYRNATEIVSTNKRLEEMVRLGLRAIRSPGDGYKWQAPRDLERVPDEVLQALHEADASLINQIGTAVILLNRPLDDDEGKR